MRLNALAGAFVLAAVMFTSVAAFATSSPAVYAFVVMKPNGTLANAAVRADNFHDGRGSPFVSSVVRVSLGTYTVTLTNAAPSSVQPMSYVQVTALGTSTAFCFENSFTVSANGFDATSTINCSTPGGALTDSGFTWFYRTESWAGGWNQAASYIYNVGYASVSSGGAADLTGSFNSWDPVAVYPQRLAPGQYKVRFGGLNTPGSTALTSSYGTTVQVGKICTTGSCRRNSCIASSWTTTSAGDASSPAVFINCYNQNGAAVDQAFRVWFGQEGLTNELDLSSTPVRGLDYAWVNYTSTTSYEIRSVSERVAAYPHVDTGTTVSRLGTGRYRITLTAHNMYDNFWSVQATSRDSGGKYCKLESITDTPGQNANSPVAVVACYSANGTPADAKFSFASVENPG